MADIVTVINPENRRVAITDQHTNGTILLIKFSKIICAEQASSDVMVARYTALPYIMQATASLPVYQVEKILGNTRHYLQTKLDLLTSWLIHLELLSGFQMNSLLVK